MKMENKPGMASLKYKFQSYKQSRDQPKTKLFSIFLSVFDNFGKERFPTQFILIQNIIIKFQF